ncbi:tRNA uridine 5-carboxymethylaminomethyl modification enzyme mnmg [Plakobranchus ocellatus]|uniref:tRNA uridine 5-carboxymethylaminomethyl modification enzyme mnmg n=1 Tax=Plakobranchus ocellatus TaxID=259542 RepID=A0AAV4CE78_9GAST|nr:tRNA uridine 5-carboxymethylaminomethyl modification enzyme mnmg [Plakobranchus ocellatus]
MAEEKDVIKAQINKFPRVESHYCRKSTGRQYLGPQLSISKLYDLYVDERKQQGIKPASKTVFESIFNPDFNLGFHVPLKDRCDFCSVFEKSSEEEKNNMKADFERHVREKDLVRIKKNEAKETAKMKDQETVICFDLQEILQTPHTFESSTY